MAKRHQDLPWFDQYPHLSNLILLSPSLQKELQVVLAECILSTLKRYIYLIRKTSPNFKLCVRPLWNLYLSNKQPDKWSEASPKLHKAYSLIMILPEDILYHIDQYAEGLVNYLCAEILTGHFDLFESKYHLYRCFNFNQTQLRCVPNSSHNVMFFISEKSPEIEAPEILGEEVLLNFR